MVSESGCSWMYFSNDFFSFSGGTLNTDIGVDSEAQVSPHFDDEKAHEEYHPQENGNQNPDLHPDDTKLDLTQQNGNSEIKTNTPV